MSDTPPPDLFGFLEDLVDEQELLDIAKRPREEVHAELVAAGIDPARVRARLEQAMREVGMSPLAVVPATVGAGAGNVASLDAARARKGGNSRWLALAFAAALLAVLGWRSRAEIVAYFTPAPTPSTPTPVPSAPPETPQQIAATIRQEAFTACAQGYYPLCRDKLDEAAVIDAVGEDTPEVSAARQQIETGGSDAGTFVKDRVAPGQRPLQPLH